MAKYSQVPLSWFLAEEPSSDSNLKAPIILKSFLELQSRHEEMKGLSHTFEDVYEILDMIHPFKVEVSPEEKGASTGQRAGTCLASATKEWIQDLSPDICFYKRFMYKVKLELLLAAFSTLESTLSLDTTCGEVARRELVMMSEKLLRRVCKLKDSFYQSNFPITEQEALQGVATAHDILNNIKQCQKQIAFQRTQEVQAFSLEHVGFENQQTCRKKIEFKYNTRTKYGFKPTVNCLDTSIILDPSSIHSFLECVKKTFEIVAILEKNQKNLAKLQLQLLITQLPPVNHNGVMYSIGELWKPGSTPQTSLQDLNQALESICQLATFYIEIEINCPSKDLVTKQQATLLPLYAIAHHLCLQIESFNKKLTGKAQLKNYRFPFPIEAIVLERLQYLHLQEYDKINLSLAYFSAINESDKPYLFETEEKSLLIKDKISQESNAEFWKALLSCDRDFRGHIDEVSKEKSYRKLSPEEIEEDYKGQQNKRAEYLEACKEYEKQKEEYSKQLEEYKKELEEYKNKVKQLENDVEYQNDLKKLYRAKHTAWLKSKDPLEKMPLPETVQKGPQKPKEPKEPKKPVEPPPLTRKTNLVDEIRRNLVLETIDLPPEPHPLDSTSYSYIMQLRRIVYKIRRACKEDSLNSIQDKNYFHPHRFMVYWNYDQDYAEILSKENKYEDKEKQHLTSLQKTIDLQGRFIGNPHKEFLQRKVASRLKQLWSQPSAEGDNLKEFKTDRDLLTDLDRTLSEDNISPIQFLYLLEKDFSLLTDPSLQSYVFELLFRSPVAGSYSLKEMRISVGAGLLVLRDKAFVEKALQFINKGFHYFKNLPQGIEGARFFLELSGYFSKYAYDAGDLELSTKFNLINALEEWLAQDSLSDEERGLLHQFSTLFCLFQTNFSTKDYSSLYAHWILFKQNPITNTKNKTPFLSRYLESCLEIITASLPPEIDINQLGQLIAKKIQVDSSLESAEWSRYSNRTADLATPYIFTPTSWYINLVEGMVYSPKGPLTVTAKPDKWEASPTFKRLFFNTKNHSYRRLNVNTFLLTVPQKGAFQIVDLNSSYFLLKSFPGCESICTYISSEIFLSQKYIPHPFAIDYAYWSPDTPFFLKGSHEAVKAIMTDLDTLAPRYVVLTDGTIVETSPQLDHIINPDVTYNFLESSFLTSLQSLTDFDDDLNIVTTFEKGSLKTISFSRYASLKFVSENGAMVWTTNKQYCLSNQKPKWLLGTIPNYLHLTSLQLGQSDLILVPYQRIIPLEIGPIASGVLGIKNPIPNSLTNIDHEAPLRIQGKNLYGVYEVTQDRKIVPTDLNSKLFLAFIELSQKRYTKAIALIKSIKPSERLTPLAKQILMNIFDLPAGEDHPNNSMVKLQALYVYFNEEIETSTHQIISFFSSLSDHLRMLGKALFFFNKIQSLSNNIDDRYRFSKDQEKLLLAIILNESMHYEEDLVKGEYLKTKELRDLQTLFQQRLDVLKDGTVSSTTREKTRTKFSLRVEDKSRNYSTMKNSETVLYHDQFIEELVPPLKEPIKPIGEEESEDYKQKLKKFHEDQEWFIQGTSIYSLPCTFHPKTEMFFLRNGIALKEVLECAFNGSPEERGAMLHRFYQWRLHSNASNQHRVLDFYISILYSPNSYNIISPHLKDLFTRSSYDEKIKYLQENQKIYSKIIADKNPKKIFDNLYSITNKPIPFLFSKKILQTQYPFMPLPILDRNTHKGGQKVNKIAICDLKITSQKERWDQLDRWKNLFSDDRTTTEKDFKDFEFNENIELLHEQEHIYKESLHNDLKTLQKDYKAGKEINQITTIKTLTKEHCNLIQSEANKCLKELEHLLNQKMAILVALANETSSDPREKIIERTKIASRASSGLTFENCIQCLLSMNKNSFRQKNKFLTNSQIHTLCELTLEILDNQSHQSQLQRILTLTQKIESSAGDRQIYYCHSLHDECSQKYHFDDFNEAERIALHVFSGKSGLIPFEKQTNLLKKMLGVNKTDPSAFKDMVIQLIMGGGKTSVIASILLYLSARRENRIALFIVPPSLQEVVTSNLAEGMDKAFGKKVHSINLQREEFTTYKLSRLLSRLQSTLHSDDTILISAVTLQGLELEMLSVARKIARRADYKDPGYKVELLASIRELIRKHADALVDEVDIVKDCMQEINFVDGEKYFVDAQRNGLLLHLFKEMINPNLKCQTKKGEVPLPNLIRLQSNQQALLPKLFFIEKIAPILANSVFQNLNSINKQLDASYQEAFIRYTTGKIPSELQRYVDKGESLNPEKISHIDAFKGKDFKMLLQDIAFLNELKTLAASKSDRERNAADLTALCKHFLCELLPTTLSKIGGRNYGPSPNENNIGKIIPYLAVNTPAITEFGYHWEAACYHYQFGLGSKPTKELVLEVAKIARETANHFAQRNGENLRTTAENEEFFETFGVHLDEVHEPIMVQKAVETVSKKPEKLLEMQYELISRYVTYASERLTSNGFALIDLIASCQGMSGTPWNVEGYEEKLATRFEADTGTDGRILHRLAEKAQGKKIYAVDFKEHNLNDPFTMKEFLAAIYAEVKNPKAIRGILEAGGVFKTFGTNSDVAKSWMEFIAERQEAEKHLPLEQKTIDPNVEGVIFFHKEEKSAQPDILYVWKKEADAPERIGGTTPYALQAKGLIPSKYVIYYDERHTTGTDILQLPDSVNLLTSDEKIRFRTLTQAIMRLRQFLFKQDVEFVVSKTTQQTLYNQAQSPYDLIMHAVKVQSIAKTEAMVRFFKQHIHNIFRRHAVQKVTDGINSLDFQEIVQRYEPFFVSYMVENPFEQHGYLDQLENTKDVLKDILIKKFDRFRKVTQDDPQLIERVESEVKSLEKWIDKTQSLPTKSKDIKKTDSLHVEILQQIEVHTQIQKEIEIENEIEIELKRFEYCASDEVKKEAPLTYNDFLEIVGSFQLNKICPQKNISLKQQLETYNYGYPISNIFDEPIFGTPAYFETIYDKHNIFHPMQKPPHQILAIEGDDGKMRWLLVSQHQAGAIKDHMESLARKFPCYSNLGRYYNGIDPDKVWFIQPDGSLICDYTNEPYPLEDERVQKGMIELNVLGGNMAYLDDPDIRLFFEEWLEKDESLKLIKVRFLKWRTFRNQKQKRLLMASPTIAKVYGQDLKEIAGVPHYGAKRRIEREKLQTLYFPINLVVANPDFSIVKTLNTAKIRRLEASYIPYLGININANDAHTEKAIKKIIADKKCDENNPTAVKEAIVKHNREVFKRLQRWQVPHLLPEQIQWIFPHQVKYLEKPQQIEKLNGEQVLQLIDSQAHLIKHVNPAHYGHFNQQWQIRNIPDEHLDKVNPEYSIYFTARQIKQLSLDSINKFKGNWKKVQMQSIHGNHIGSIYTGPIDSIPPKYKQYITEEQVKEITDPGMIRKLEYFTDFSFHKVPLSRWIDRSMLIHVPEDKTRCLSPEQRAELIFRKKLNQLIVSKSWKLSSPSEKSPFTIPDSI